MEEKTNISQEKINSGDASGRHVSQGTGISNRSASGGFLDKKSVEHGINNVDDKYSKINSINQSRAINEVDTRISEINSINRGGAKNEVDNRISRMNSVNRAGARNNVDNRISRINSYSKDSIDKLSRNHAGSSRDVSHVNNSNIHKDEQSDKPSSKPSSFTLNISGAGSAKNKNKGSRVKKNIGVSKDGDKIREDGMLNAPEHGMQWKRAVRFAQCRRCYKHDKNTPEVEVNKNYICRKCYNRRRRIIISSICLVLLLLAVASLVVQCKNWFDPNSEQGHWEGKSREQIVADLNADVQKGEMNVSIANTIKFYHGSQNNGIAHIENIKANPMDQKVTIRLADTGEILYESGALAPDHCINNIRLNKWLANGMYHAVATFYAYERDTHDYLGSVNADIRLYVEGDDQPVREDDSKKSDNNDEHKD